MKRPYTSRKRMTELARYLKKNKDASVRDFVRETGGTSDQYYYVRQIVGLASKRGPRKKPMTVDKEVAINVPVQPKDEIVVEGNTPDFIWYEINLMQRKLSDIIARMSHINKISQNRDQEQKKMLQGLIQETSELRVENNSLKQQVSELTEMINGASV